MDTIATNDDTVFSILNHIPNKRWSLVLTRPRNEKWAYQHLQENGITVYLPLLTKVEVHNRSKRTTQIPMFPGYLFSCQDVLEDTTIRRNKVVWSLRPLPATEEEALLKDLRLVRTCELQSAEHKLVVNPGLQAGMTVRVKSGTFKGQEAIVSRRVDEVNVIINLFFLGQNIEMRWNADELEI